MYRGKTLYRYKQKAGSYLQANQRSPRKDKAQSILGLGLLTSCAVFKSPVYGILL